MPAQTDDHAWDVANAECTLARFDPEAVSQRVDRLEAAVQNSFIEISDLGLSVSQYPGEDDGHNAPSQDTTRYVLDHLLPHALNPKQTKIYGRNQLLVDLLNELEPEEFVAVVLLYADRVGDAEGVRRAHDILVINPAPYVELIGAYRRRRKGGQGKRENIAQVLAERDAKIRKEAGTLRAAGRPKNEIASVLAERHGFSPQHIRRILKKTNMR